MFLGVDLPDCTVSEESTSNPLDNIWDCYDRIIRNDLEEFSRVMTYAGRGGYKSLGASILETMCLLHTPRNIGHMAATKPQARKSAGYVKDFFFRELLRDFVMGDSADRVRIVHYTHKQTGEILNDGEYSQLPPTQQSEFHRSDNYVKVVVCTLTGSQSDHTELFIVDEIDVVPAANVHAYHLASNIPDPRDGMLPLTLLTSTRKFRTGLVQQELDDAERTKLIVKHWNLIDVTAACEPERHLPKKPKATYYVNDDLVTHISEEEYGVLNPGQQKSWYPVEGFAGCVKCRIFSACKSRLATHQTCKANTLKPITFAINQFAKAKTPDLISTEYLSRKAETTGLVYPRLLAEKHLKTAAEMAELVDGNAHPEDFGKAQLIKLLKEKGAAFYAGMDFGFIHPFAVTTYAQFGQYAFILDCYAQSGLELDEQTANCEYLKTVYDNPVIYPDMASPGSIKTFRTRGFRARDWEKKPFSVKAGIEIVRSLLWSGAGKIRMFFLKGDSGVADLFKEMVEYKYKVNAAGMPTEEPIEVDDDRADSIRYGVMNSLGSDGSLKEKKSAIVKESTQNTTPQAITKQDAIAKPGVQQQWLVDEIRQLTGQQTQISNGVVTKGTVKKNRFVFDI
jgi:hypothetical protein